MKRYQDFQKIISFIILLTKEVQSLTEQEINDILEETVTVKIVLKPKSSKQLNTQVKTTISKEVSSTEEDTNFVDELEVSTIETEISSTEGLESKSEPLKTEQGVDIAKPSPEQVAKTLQELDTREEGVKILDELPKNALQHLAVHINIPNSKKYSIKELRKKIIEATIGFRLRSKAIRDEPIETDWTKFLKKETPETDLIEATQDETLSRSTEEL